MLTLSHFIKENGKSNSMRSKESYVIKHDIELYNKVQKHISDNNIKVSKFSESLYYYFNNIVHQVKCNNSNCNNTASFISLSSGHLKYCSSKCSNSSDDVKNKKIKSFNDKYGVDNPFQADEVKRKSKLTLISRYGVDNPMRSEPIRRNMMKRSLDNNGTKWALSKGGAAYNSRVKRERLKYDKLLSNNISIIEWSESKNGVCKFRCSNCDSEFDATKYLIYQRSNNNVEQCLLCNPVGSFNSTNQQLEVVEFIKNLGFDVIEHDRKILNGKELDIVIPEKNIAIELDGLYWHSELYKESNYHLNKTDLCEANNIQLIHIFEDEWANKKEIVKSRIKSILGKSTTSIYARKCNIKKINSKVCREFIELNHLQGYIPASVKLGLYYEDELVSVMTFGKLRAALGNKGTDSEYEMYRFCNKIGYSVVGGASKLLSHFIKHFNPTYILSYADRRWSIGKLYDKLKFKMEGKSDPNFWYVKNGIRYHRFNFRKSELVKEGYDPSKTAHEIMLDRKMYRIYDCGNIKYTMKINN